MSGAQMLARPEVDAALRAVEETRNRYCELPADVPARIHDAALLEMRAAELRRDALLADARRAAP